MRIIMWNMYDMHFFRQYDILFFIRRVLISSGTAIFLFETSCRKYVILLDLQRLVIT